MKAGVVAACDQAEQQAMDGELIAYELSDVARRVGSCGCYWKEDGRETTG
jgi:hypothetical protein